MNSGMQKLVLKLAARPEKVVAALVGIVEAAPVVVPLAAAAGACYGIYRLAKGLKKAPAK